MAMGLTITIVDPDDDYLGIDMHAANVRFAGSARIYAGLDELSAFRGSDRGLSDEPSGRAGV
jgi:hypothetical protein